MYRTMVEKLYQFITGLIFEQSASERDSLALSKIIEDLPEASPKQFCEHFLSLCSQFNEFYIFMGTGREREAKADKCYQAALSAATHMQKNTEAGFADLKAIILNLQVYCKTDQVQEIVDGLINTYHRNNIESPVIGKTDIDEKLNYPQIGQTVIPHQNEKIIVLTPERRSAISPDKVLYCQTGRMLFHCARVSADFAIDVWSCLR